MQVILADDSHREKCIEIAQNALGAGREISEYFDMENCFFAYTDGGFCAMLVSFDYADLVDIAVDEQKRKSGVATALMDFAHSECKKRGVKEVLLEVRQSNAPAIALYEKQGYLRISVRKKYYSAPTEDAIIMRKVL